MSERSRFLTCQNLDHVLSFHEALGFDLTCRQERQNPYLCLKHGDLDIHFSAVAGCEPENSPGSLIVLASDGGGLFDQFAAGPT
ncbi:hypothetical protein BLJ79_03885 [Arthrobacter sp. UCD-GKA]|uniref:hypothetical protein n=1 Tax=Arthrobacter sp. UCD-GKA TaxID=1913576 RepID=UPI0008DD3CAE|nr:hypothetical protein [Arthrobacter sp. UCD-GKA]OIH85943.1 hypothetical protein BLJ79_03885 [Arthrobacter sp. UCD-GKA]